MTSHDKNNHKNYATIITLAILLCSLTLLSPYYFANAEDANQRILELRKQIEELTRQAEQYKKTITKTQKEAGALQKQINTINAQIGNLTTQIAITEKQIDKTGIEIDYTGIKIGQTIYSITNKQGAIGELVKSLHERDQETLLAVLLKNNSFSDFMNQIRYSENLNEKLTSLLSDLKKEKEVLEIEKNDLETKKLELENLNRKRSNQKISLNDTKQSKNTLLVQTKGQESRYRDLLNEAEKKKAAFFEELKSLESYTLNSGNLILRVTTKIPPAGTKLFAHPYDDYAQTQSYGMTAYARKGAYGGAPHNGVDFASGAGSEIHPIGPGKIITSGNNAGWGNWIAVKHDNDMVSLYAHMKAPTALANNTPVKPTDIIGYEGSTGNSTGSHLHLSLYWDFFTYINPKNGQLYFNYFDGTLNPLDYM